jgi:hypothetical protein
VISPFRVYVKDTYKSLVFPPNVPRVLGDISKKCAVLWNNLSEEQRQVYQDKAARMTREREEEREEGGDAKRSKVKESDSEDEESDSDTSESSE